MGVLSAIQIPKESSPSINLGIISISTSYFGTNPVDMDALVTDKIYKEIKDIKWIDKIESSSSLWFSSIVLTLRTDAEMQDVLSEVRSSVARVPLPGDAKTPVITEIKTDTNRTFSVFLYSKDRNVSQSALFDRAKILQDAIESVSWVNSVTLSVWGFSGPVTTGWWDDSAYEVEITIPQDRLDALWLTLASIANTIQSYNRDQPLGNFIIGDKNYDFRIEGKNTKSYDFLEIPIALPAWGTIILSDIASIDRRYKNTSKRVVVLPIDTGIELSCDPSDGAQVISKSCLWQSGYPYVWLTVNKNDSVSIFSVSDRAKQKIDTMLNTSEFEWYGRLYATDLADNIRDDYVSLARNASMTIILVFFAMFLFVGWRDALFAIIALPLAFLATFIMLNSFGYTMNFLTNFSLIISFGIAIDTVIVIVEAASVNQRLWYNPRTAITLALKKYAIPVITGVLTSIVVFIPMMVLPGVLGKFMAYIPITIFWVLAFGLVLVLTVNNALYILFNKKRSYYTEDLHALEHMSPDERELLMIEREGKEHRTAEEHSLRARILLSIEDTYRHIATRMLERVLWRRVAIIGPVALLILSIQFLAPLVGFNLFPWDDNAYTSFNIVWPVWQITEKTTQDLSWIDAVFIWYPEIEHASITINNNRANIAVQLTKKSVRKDLWQRSVYDIEKILLQKLQIYEETWYRVTSEVLQNGPPGGKAIGIDLIADTPEKLDTLIAVSKDFENFLHTFTGSKNVWRSSSDTPWQFIFSLDKQLIASIGVNPSTIYSQMMQNMNGINIWSIEDNATDMSVYIKTDKFGDRVTIEDILGIPIAVWNTTYLLGDLIDSRLSNAIASISRSNGDIQITVDADLEDGMDTVSSQAAYTQFASGYKYPPGISYKTWGENQENAELIIAIGSAFFLSLLAIFAILVLQFQSYSQPALILYSAIFATPLVMVGLYITDNPFSLTFGIGFIAFTGVAVNDAIVLLSAINSNIAKWMTGVKVLVESAVSRIQPIMLTSVTTILGMLSIATQDKFWSGLWYTIIFGIVGASILTLFSIQAIYYELYVSPDRWRIRRILSRIAQIFRRRKKRG